MNLRLPGEILNGIDSARVSGETPKSRNTWIMDAIEKKLAEEAPALFGKPAPYKESALTYYEFFAGGGMARMGLGNAWQCLFANDNDRKKAEAYALNWGGADLKVCDIRDIETSQLPGQADLAWASFPCQDLSLAGAGAGLRGMNSSTFWPFWDLMKRLDSESRKPRTIVLENVPGAISSDNGKDLKTILTSLAEKGYVFGPLVIDAAHFLPQSRPRLFIVAVDESIADIKDLVVDAPERPFHTEALEEAFDRFPEPLRENWRWWRLPTPPERTSVLRDLIDQEPVGVEWHTREETQRLLDMMSPVNLRKVEAARKSGEFTVGTLYRRTREVSGKKMQRAEVRFDDVAGCLRTPRGGSSRQTLLIVDGEFIRSRLLSPREAARLMGLPDAYKLPQRYNDAYHLAGDGLVVPAVSHLVQHLLEPIAWRRNFKRDVAV
ncbi:MAG: DNA cytosine methyltransferase [Opitutales bacterium]